MGSLTAVASGVSFLFPLTFVASLNTLVTLLFSFFNLSISSVNLFALTAKICSPILRSISSFSLLSAWTLLLTSSVSLASPAAFFILTVSEAISCDVVGVVV